MLYCSDCRVMAHPECRERVPMPCLAIVSTPRSTSGTTIGDYCSKNSPMVPPLIVHCVFEVEARGLCEVGIYRIPGAERDVRALKVRFLLLLSSKAINFLLTLCSNRLNFRIVFYEAKVFALYRATTFM